MNKTFQMPIHVVASSVAEQHVVRIHISHGCLSEWCLSLQLLHDDLVEKCIFTIHESGGIFLKIEKGPSSSYTISHFGKKHAVLLERVALDMLRHFFLHYYRDGYAEVDHIDIDDEGHPGGYITFSVEKFAEPLSPAALKAKLDVK